MKSSYKDAGNSKSILISAWLLIFSMGFFIMIFSEGNEALVSMIYTLRLIYSIGIILLIANSALCCAKVLPFIGRNRD